MILRSETGESWKEHHCEHTQEELNQILNGMDEGPSVCSPVKSSEPLSPVTLCYQLSSFRVGPTGGAGEEAYLSHHYQGFPAVLCGGLAHQAGQ